MLHIQYFVGSSPGRGKAKTMTWYLSLLHEAHSIKEKGQRVVGSESGWCVRVGRHEYPCTVVQWAQWNPSKKWYLKSILIVRFERNLFINPYIEQSIWTSVWTSVIQSARSSLKMDAWPKFLYPCTVVQWAQWNPSKRVGLVQCGHHYHLIECNILSPWYLGEKLLVW
jgi:hypothetical protein